MSLLQRALLSRRVGRLVLEQIDGIELVVLPEVFNPAVFRTSPLLLESIAEHVRSGTRVLDVGTGTGVAAIAACSVGAGHIVAIDVNPEAVRCARMNALLNHVDDRIDVRHGDLFEPAVGERFDAVLCNPPFFRGQPSSALDAAWRSEDFLTRFGEGLGDMLAPDGFALIVFSNHADERGLTSALAGTGWQTRAERTRDLGNEVITVYRVSRGALR